MNINFLDVTFNLNNSTYRPFTKPNTTLQYVHRESKHPPIITKNIPAGINRRLSSLSSDKASFDQATAPPRPPAPYQKALDEKMYGCSAGPKRGGRNNERPYIRLC